VLSSPSVTSSATTGATPFAWIDDASLLPSRRLSVSISTSFWHGTDLSEVDVPVVGVSLGVTDRVQGLRA